MALPVPLPDRTDFSIRLNFHSKERGLVVIQSGLVWNTPVVLGKGVILPSNLDPFEWADLGLQLDTAVQMIESTGLWDWWKTRISHPSHPIPGRPLQRYYGFSLFPTYRQAGPMNVGIGDLDKHVIWLESADDRSLDAGGDIAACRADID